jgi:hypothetical protein
MTEIPIFVGFAERLDAMPKPERAANEGKPKRPELVEAALASLSPEQSLKATMLRRCRGLMTLKDVSFGELNRTGKHSPNYWNRKVSPEATPDHPEEMRLVDLDYLLLVLGLPIEAVMFVPLCDADAWALALLANVAESGDAAMARERLAQCVPGHALMIDRLLAQRLIVLDVSKDTVELAETALPLLSVRTTSGGRLFVPNRNTVRIYFSAPGVRVPQPYGRESTEPPIGQIVNPNADSPSR